MFRRTSKYPGVLGRLDVRLNVLNVLDTSCLDLYLFSFRAPGLEPLLVKRSGVEWCNVAVLHTIYRHAHINTGDLVTLMQY